MTCDVRQPVQEALCSPGPGGSEPRVLLSTVEVKILE